MRHKKVEPTKVVRVFVSDAAKVRAFAKKSGVVEFSDAFRLLMSRKKP